MPCRLPALAAAFGAALLLAGCVQPPPQAPMRLEPTYESAARAPLLHSSREAIARLLSGLDTTVTGPGPVLVATVVNINDLGMSAPLGRTLSEQYANAMAMAGFDVKEIKLRGEVFVKEGAGELLLSREIRDIARHHSASMVLVGTFSPAASYTYVSLKLVRTEDSRIIRGHDYALPNDRDITRLLVPR
ncbi:FlgO family outer membrane protein [Melaminivora sp.]|uniref:FlgO family outer membrane protein n=1 Tax=Melaminivora sp. TaxID=1933032 RepID=UPI0028B038BE|nr:FlgO family outer membrane protein [Melaminivora sp.]